MGDLINGQLKNALKDTMKAIHPSGYKMVNSLQLQQPKTATSSHIITSRIFLCVNSLIECGTASHPREYTFTPSSPQTELNMARPSDTGTPHFSPQTALNIRHLSVMALQILSFRQH